MILKHKMQDTPPSASNWLSNLLLTVLSRPSYSSWMVAPPPPLQTPYSRSRANLEELDYIFAVPTRTHMKYQATQNLPWWFRTYVLHRKGLAKPQLYKLGNLPQAPSVTAQLKYFWSAGVLRKKGVAKPEARGQPVASTNEAFAEKHA